MHKVPEFALYASISFFILEFTVCLWYNLYITLYQKRRLGVMGKFKMFLKILLGILAAVLLAALIYLLYVVFSFYRLEDNIPLSVTGEAAAEAPIGESLTLLTYNIGFGAYSDDYSFFMDGGEYARAFSEEAVIANTKGSISAAESADPDFLLLQEVDVYGDRSYHVDQTGMFADALSGYDRVFAQNYDSPYFLYPFNEPIGANRSGIMTFSRFNITDAIRRSLPIEESLNKYFDLDRAYSRSVIPCEGGKSLVLYNVHLSAYTSDGSIADEQLRLLSQDMKAEYDKGNYVVAAGDFNKDILGDSSLYFKRGGEGDFTWAKPLDMSLLPEGFICRSGTNAPTCRNADSAYRADGTDFVLSVDGVIVSPNVELVKCETVDNAFKYSDHNPVFCEFILH